MSAVDAATSPAPTVTATGTSTSTPSPTSTVTTTPSITPGVSPTPIEAVKLNSVASAAVIPGRLMFRYCEGCTTWDGPTADMVTLYSADADGGNLTQVTHDLLGHDYLESFSPDGRRMLVSSFTQEFEDDDSTGNLYVMDIDGTQAVKITESYTRGPFTQPHNAIWLEDGSGRITFVQRTADRHWGITTADPDGSSQSLITEAPGASQVGSITELPDNTTLWWETGIHTPDSWSPVWQHGAESETKQPAEFQWQPLSAVGSEVVWYQQSELFYDHWYHVVSVGPMGDPDNARVTCLAPGDVGPAQYSMSPDKSKVFLVDGQPWNSSNYYICSIDGSPVIRLPAWEVGAASSPPSWSTDGRYLLFEERTEYVLNILDLETMSISHKFRDWINPSGGTDQFHGGPYAPAFGVVWVPEPQ